MSTALSPIRSIARAIIASDPESYLAVEPDWEPTLPGHESRFHLRDILTPA